MRARFSWLTIALLVAVAPAATAIINGTVDAAHPAVGVLTDPAGTQAMASATLIAPSWVLTTAHFVEACPVGVFRLGPDWSAPEATRPFDAVFPHPAWVPGGPDHDIALVRLSAPVTDVAPIPLLTSSSAIMAGATVAFVGYGATSLHDFSNTVRRICWNTIDEVYASSFVTWFDGCGPYLGDAGGPALISSGGIERIAGVIAAMDEAGTYTISTKVPAYLAFLQATMSENPPVAVPEPLTASALTAAPNPFNPRTEISFTLAAPAHCELTIHDLRGREVAVLLAGSRDAGRVAVAWDGRAVDERACESGIYLARLTTSDGARRTVKLVLAR